MIKRKLLRIKILNFCTIIQKFISYIYAFKAEIGEAYNSVLCPKLKNLHVSVYYGNTTHFGVFLEHEFTTWDSIILMNIQTLFTKAIKFKYKFREEKGYASQVIDFV